MMLHKSLCFLINLLLLVILYNTPLLAQPQLSAKELRETGMRYYEAGKYLRALKNFLRYQRFKADDVEVKQKIGICYYYVNNPAEAKKYLNYVLENDKKPGEEVYLYRAKSEHLDHNFSAAIADYKQYLRMTKPADPFRRQVRNDIKRCAQGLTLLHAEQVGIVENLGEGINTSWDDFGAVLSPNNPDRLYFSSAREGSTGGLRNEKGLADEANGTYDADMYIGEYDGSNWVTLEAMSNLLNSPRQDVLLGFTNDGLVMYYYQGLGYNEGDILMDTFKANIEDKLLFSPKFESPIVTQQGDQGIYFVNDTTLLFASRRVGGYGGYDLYWTIRIADQWQPPQNMGAIINSAYDEATPFLASDGKTLYFSNNSLQSIGGFDVFSSTFDAAAQRWSAPTNVGFPINSAGDDTYFRIDAEGNKAYLTSNRKESIGQGDIFGCVFKQSVDAMLTKEPVAFLLPPEGASSVASQSNMPLIQGSASEKKKSPPPVPNSAEKRQEYKLAPLYYTDDNDVLGELNEQQLNKLAVLLGTYPQIKVELSGHNYKADAPILEAYLTHKRAKKVAQYLADNGIAANRISLKGFGINYPVAKTAVDGKVNPAGQRYNRRIDMVLHHTQDLPVNIIDDSPAIGDYLKNEAADRYKLMTKGLSYKVQVATSKQIYNNPDIQNYADFSVESTLGEESMHCTVGLYRTFASAAQLKQDLQSKGIKAAKVIPYINGWRLEANDLESYTDLYPDLLNYLAAQGK